MSRQDDLKKLITEYTRRLQKLREQQARKGIDTEPHILIEIEDIEATIKELQAELATVEETEKEPPQPKLAASPAVAAPVTPTVAADPQMTARRAQPRIFLCHATEDKPRVMELYHQLKDAGYRPWLDKFDLLPGQKWQPAIKKIITDLNNIILVCLSNNSITKRGVVQQEIRWALDILERMPEETIYLIPVRLEACQAPDQLSDLQWVDLFEPDGFEKLKRALDYEIGKRQVVPESEAPIEEDYLGKPILGSEAHDPFIASIQSQLKSIRSGSKSPSLVAAAGAAIAQEQAKREAEAARKRTEQEERSELAQDAIKSLDFVLEVMFQSIIEDAPVAGRLGPRAIGLGSGQVSVEIPFPMLPGDAFPDWRKNIICGAVIRVEQTHSRYRGRSANLWFGELGNQGEFRWWEIPYFSLGPMKQSFFNPFGVETQSGLRDVDLAGSPIGHIVQQAAKPVPIDGEHIAEFIERWSARLALASKNELQSPSSLPE